MDRHDEIEALLEQAKTAHAEYERGELGGVYDTDWPRWYASYLVEHDLARLIGRPLEAAELAVILEDSWAEQEMIAPTEPWEVFTAARIAGRLSG